MKRARDRRPDDCILRSYQFRSIGFMFLFAPFSPDLTIRRKLCERRLWDLFYFRRCLFPKCISQRRLFYPSGRQENRCHLLTDCILMVRQHSDRFYMPIYRTCPVGDLQCDADRREWLKCAGAVMVKKGVWLENLTGKGKMKNIFCGKMKKKH